MLKKIRKELSAQVAGREKALALQRQIIPLCSQAIRDVQKNKHAAALRQTRNVAAKLKKAEKLLQKTPELVEPVLGSAYQEYAELSILTSYLKTRKLPALDVPAKYYLLGLSDAVGELKRVGMQMLAEHKLSDAEKMADDLEKLYSELSKTMYPNAVVPGLKPKLDSLRRTLNSFQDAILSHKLTRP